MSEKEQATEQPNSCEISINAKGQWSGKVKVYAETINDAIALAFTKAQELNDEIKKHNEVKE